MATKSTTTQSNTTRLDIKNKYFKLGIESTEDCPMSIKTFTSEVNNFVNRMLEEMDVALMKPDQRFISKANLSSVPMQEAVPLRPVGKKDDSTFNIRKRIPNNVVDVSSLDVKKAITEEVQIRCPHCGQKMIIAIKNNDNDNEFHLMRVADNDKKFASFKYIKDISKEELDKMTLADKDKVLSYYKDIKKLKIAKKDIDVVCVNETEIYCPVCGESDTFNEWKKAYSTPLDYFESENLCPICGGTQYVRSLKKEDGSFIQIYECETCATQIDTNGELYNEGFDKVK